MVAAAAAAISRPQTPKLKQDGYKIGGWDWRYTLAIVSTACLFQAKEPTPFTSQISQQPVLEVAILGRFYEHCTPALTAPLGSASRPFSSGDLRFGNATTWQAVTRPLWGSRSHRHKSPALRPC